MGEHRAYGMATGGNIYPKYTSRNPLVRVVVDSFNKKLVKLLAERKAGKLLDVGCGEGHLTSIIMSEMPGLEVFATDISKKTILDNRGRLDRFCPVVSDASKLPYARSTFDCVILTQVLEHVPNPADCVLEAARVSERLCVYTVPNEPYWRMMNVLRLNHLRAFGNTPGHINHWSKRGLETFLGSLMDRVEVSSAGLWLIAVCERGK